MKSLLFDYEIDFWLRESYPLTIIADRYGGCYSGAKFLAFPFDLDQIDMDVCGGDPECWNFWDEYDDFVGKGGTIAEAVGNLKAQLQAEKDGGYQHVLKLNRK